ncbi:hypothetical protein NDN08_007688 [Rhodosorus marinus]|uniref:Fe2OG dioxygenase domain-containing protein n=1 Tax=Rhodosorus marinus TaxID=101924 RepID=A0AAV8V1V0_9RHOD|nr:hypothetical protein NDN08_007688 [Rhodosorus marinus]
MYCFAGPVLGFYFRPQTGRRGRVCAVQKTEKLKGLLEKWGLPNMDLVNEFARAKLIHEDPPIIMVEDFLDPTRCMILRQYARRTRQLNEKDAESDLYLNYRVNAENREDTSSEEAKQLLEEQNIPTSTLSADMGSGFRLQVPPPLVRPILPELLRLMGLQGRTVEFEEGIWYKPNKRTMYIRDQTVVHYLLNEGVAPHVDGKDATLLCYLNDMEDGGGGKTCFPEIGLSVQAKAGSALLYESNKGLLHYAEAVTKGEKWIMQLLIDFKYDPNIPAVDYNTGQIIE